MTIKSLRLEEVNNTIMSHALACLKNFLYLYYAKSPDRKLNIWSFYSRLDELMILYSELNLVTIKEAYILCGISYEEVMKKIGEFDNG